MPLFELGDTVVLKSDGKLYGTVVRSYIDGPDHLEDLLIIAHVPVPSEVLDKFAKDGVPPRGYTFVKFWDDGLGHSLVSEEDLHLLCRSLNIDDAVRIEDRGMTGRVVSVSESFILRPIVFHHPNRDSLAQVFERPQHRQPRCTSQCSSLPTPPVDYPYPHELIYNVPGYELKRAADISEGDFLVRREWAGIATDPDTDVILLLDDGSIVAVDDMATFHTPIPEPDKPLVSPPEFDDISRPDVVVALQGWSTTIPVEHPRRGQVVVVNRTDLAMGRYLRGSHNADLRSKAIVLDVRTKEFGMRWVDGNAFAGTAFITGTPLSTNRIYRGYNTFRNNTELRRREAWRIFDSRRRPLKEEPASEKASTTNSHSAGESQVFIVGTRVKFRDATAAAAKYTGINGTTHGRYHRIPPDETDFWDLNELEVVAGEITCIVQWQDGSHTTHSSNTLKRYLLFEEELSPSDIVVKREGLKQRLGPQMTPAQKSGHEPIPAKAPAVPFNEMTFQERPNDLIPDKVGVIQSVDSKQSLAQVRWFSKPRIELFLSGYTLSPASKFGPIGDPVEDVSLYEIMSFPALKLERLSMVTIPPAFPFKSRLKKLHEREQYKVQRVYSIAEDRARGMEEVHPSRALICAEELIRDRDLHKTYKSRLDPSIQDRSLRHDWLGKVISLNLDGSILVRLGCENPCLDRLISRDEIISVVDDDIVTYDYEDDNSDEDMGYGSSSDDEEDWGSERSVSTIEEHVEYEGGERMDQDSNDENWISEDEEEMDLDGDPMAHASLPDDDDDTDSDIPDLLDDDDEAEAYENLTEKKFTSIPDSNSPLAALRAYLPESAPATFDILEQEPPPDQFGVKVSSSSYSSSFIKRIRREHKILSTALPKDEIYVRTYESRLDLMRCLIIGPKDTPYEFAPMMIDLHIGPKFPEEPPQAFFYSWAGGIGRINPNLYEEGRICLSLLGTWPGKETTEGWTEKATILQILVSLQGLVLVKKPFYNEAGYEEYEADNLYARESLQYSEKAFVVARGFIKHALFQPPKGLEDILAWSYLPHKRIVTSSASELTVPSSRFSESWSSASILENVLRRVNSLIKKSEQYQSEQGLLSSGDEILLDGAGKNSNSTTTFLSPLSKGAIVMLKRITKDLEDALKKLSTAPEESPRYANKSGIPCSSSDIHASADPLKTKSKALLEHEEDDNNDSNDEDNDEDNDQVGVMEMEVD